MHAAFLQCQRPCPGSRRMMNTPRLMLPDACRRLPMSSDSRSTVSDPPWLPTQSPTLVSGRTGRLSASKSAAAAAATLQGSGFPFRVGARQRNPDCPHVQPPITPEVMPKRARTAWRLRQLVAGPLQRCRIPSPRCCRRLLLPSTSCTSCPQGAVSQRLCEEGRFRKKVHGPFERLQACSSLSLQPSPASAFPGCRAASGSVPLPPSCA